jgi:DNA-binding transcriptional regulator YdaS (Cro superfamily)
MANENTDKAISLAALAEAKAILKRKGLRLEVELGITRGAVWQWTLDDRDIPSKHCQKIHALTDNRVTCQRLNPKVFGWPNEMEEAHT